MIRLLLPLPDKRLSPNARSHPLALAAARKAARLIGLHAGSVSRQENPERQYPVDPYGIRYTFRFADRRRRDLDNLIAAMKSYLDGIVDSGIIADDSRLLAITGIRVSPVAKGEAGTVVEVVEANDSAFAPHNRVFE